MEIIVQKLTKTNVKVLSTKISNRPLKIGIDRSISSSAEQSYQKTLFSKQNHGAIVTNVVEGRVNFFVMTHNAPDRLDDNYIVNIDNHAIVSYVTDLIEFFKLVEHSSLPNSQIGFVEIGVWIDFISKLENKSLQPLEIDYSLHCELKDFLKQNSHLNNSSDIILAKCNAIEEFLKIKGGVNISVQYINDNKIGVYRNTDIENFINPEIIKSMVGCSSDILDIATRICEVADPATKVILYPILERLGLLLLEKPESNPRFYFDSSKISVKEEFVKVNKVMVIEEGSKLLELNEIDDVNFKPCEGMKLLEFNKSEWE